MSIDNIISAATAEALKALYGLEVEASTINPTATRKEFEGNLTIVVFPFVKAARKSPQATATEIGDYLQSHCEAVKAYNVINGFLNITIEPKFWLGVMKHISETDSYGFRSETPDSSLVMIEYSSPNTNKPLHLGHVRNNLLGFSLSRIMKANGYKVVKTNIVNDRGIHICKSMLAWLKWGNGATPDSTGMKGDHLIGDFYVAFDKHYKEELKQLQEQGMTKEEAEAASPLMKEAREMLRKWEAGDEEVRSLWRKMNEWVYAGFDETYKRLGVDFDKIYYESETYLEGKEKVLEGLEKGIMYRKDDGSVWADLTADGLDHKLLLRSDGTSVYMTQDIGTAKLRFRDYPIDKMIYVVGNEQNYHFQVLSLLLDRLGFKWGKDLVHFSARQRASSGTRRSATVYKIAAGNIRIGNTIAWIVPYAAIDASSDPPARASPQGMRNCSSVTSPERRYALSASGTQSFAIRARMPRRFPAAGTSANVFWSICS